MGPRAAKAVIDQRATSTTAQIYALEDGFATQTHGQGVQEAERMTNADARRR